MNEIEQNYAGDVLCVPYSDDGHLRALVFNNLGEQLIELDLNTEFGMDKKSIPILGLFNPMVTACFI